MRLLRRMLDYVKSLFNLAEIGQARSSITNPLQWTLVILLGTVLLTGIARLPAWIIGTSFIALLVILMLFVYTYTYCLHKNPDVLRSENFHLSKMAIEHGLVGDSTHGLVEAKGDLSADRLRLIEGEKPGEARG